ncbi:hypothetical protein V2K54_03745 [Pseudomonas alliivorans]|nr:hypothetical protein [Pseudomonas alliivorans]
MKDSVEGRIEAAIAANVPYRKTLQINTLRNLMQNGRCSVCSQAVEALLRGQHLQLPEKQIVFKINGLDSGTDPAMT